MVSIQTKEALIREQRADGPDRIITSLTVDEAFLKALREAMADGFYVEVVEHVHDFRGVGVVSGGTMAYAAQIVEQCNRCPVYRIRDTEDVAWVQPDDEEDKDG